MSGAVIVPSHSDSQKIYNKIIAWVTGILTLSLAFCSFILSFNALSDLAARHGFTIPTLFPLIVEAGVIIFSLNALYRSIYNERAIWQWILVIGSSLLAGLFNVLHAQSDVVSRFMAVMPSLFLLLSFETFLGQIKHSITRTSIIQSIGQLSDELNTKRKELDDLLASNQQQVNQLRSEADSLTKDVAQTTDQLYLLRSEAKQLESQQFNSNTHSRQSKVTQDAGSMTQRRDNLVSILETEGNTGATGLANRLNVARGTVYNDLKALSEAGVIHKNSEGWEVVQ
jgi:hypothetical protein